MKILMVDDSALDRKLMSRILAKGEVAHPILEAEDGEKGLELLAQNFQDICVILLDWQMPKVSGIDFMAAMVKIPALAEIPVVMVTASGSDENKKLARDTNPRLAGYLVKPYKADELIAAVKTYLK